jgi:hypothetical protein
VNNFNKLKGKEVLSKYEDSKGDAQRIRLAAVLGFYNVQPGTAAE